MCTVAVVATPSVGDGEGFVVAGNRDELHGRPEAEPWRLVRRDGLAVLMPRDPAGGGTWLAANELGVVVTLLNGWSLEASSPAAAAGLEAISRGRLVAQMAGARSVDQVIEALETGHWRGLLPRVRPFVLLAAEPGPRLMQARWDGLVLRGEELALPHVEVSSSVLPELAERGRRQALEHQLVRAAEPGAAQRLRAAFADHGPTPGPASVCVHRDDARTRSFSMVQVGQGVVEVTHVAGAPCQADAVETRHRLALSAATVGASPLL